LKKTLQKEKPEKQDIENNEIEKIMEEKGLDMEQAWRTYQQRKERDFVEKQWAKSEKEKTLKSATDEKPEITEIPKQLQKDTLRFCFVNYKIPTPKGWQQKENTYKYDDPKLLERINTGRNYGVIGGYGNIMIVDADDEKIIDAFSVFGDTFTVKTGNGTHPYYFVPNLQKSYALAQETKNSTPENLQFENIGHITSKGRMVVAPGCKHYKQIDDKNFEPTGKNYEVVKNVDIKVITEEQLTAVIKPFLATEIRKQHEIQADAKTDSTNSIDIPISQVAEKMMDLRKTTPGYRGHNPDHPQSKSRMDLAIDTKKNWWVCGACASNGYGFGNALYLIALNEGVIHCHECKKGGLRGDKFLQVKTLAIEKYGIDTTYFGVTLPNTPDITEDSKEYKLKLELLEEYGAIYTDDKNKKRVNCPQLAKFLLFEDDRDYLILRDNQDILIYNGSYFESNTECLIENRINYYIDNITTNRIKSETLGFIKNSHYTEREHLEQPLNLINLKNGLYDINTGELIPHHPKYSFQYEIPVNYDKKADCPIWKKFLEDVLYQEDLAFMQEVCGYILYRLYKWALLVILLGHGRNGKTTFINAISKLLGKENVEHIPLQTIAHERFAKAKLYQKHANLCSDLGAHEIKDTGTIKQLTGMDTIFARELYKNGFNFLNHAKLIFGCNILPDIGDRTLAMSERIAVVEFPNAFKRNDENTDPDLIDKLIVEIPGIFNWMVEGLKRLLENKKFSPYRDFENVSDYLKTSQDPVKIFVDTYITSDSEGIIQKDVVYNKYLDFCKKNKYPSLVANWFSQKFKPFAPMGIDEGQPRKGGHKTVWKGIQFKNVEEKSTDTQQEEINC